MIDGNLNEMDCIMVEQMTEARTGKEKSETVKDAARIVEEGRKKMQEHQL